MPEIREITSGLLYPEGPVAMDDGSVIVTELQTGRLVRVQPAGFSSDFVDPAPWYFRTLESWIQLFMTSGLRLVELREPIHPQTQKPASVIFIAEVATSPK